MTQTAAGFDEGWYLSTYPDVNAAVRAGHYRSGFHHYELRGKSEGRAGSEALNDLEKRKVLVGRNGWLFLQNDTNHVIEQITGQYSVPENFRGEWRDLFEARYARIASLNAKYLFAVAPNKECVYPEKLPVGMALAPIRPVSLVMEEAREALNGAAIYPLDALRIRAREVDVYPRGDTHWNIHGALVFFDAMMEALGLQAMDRSGLELNSILSAGDLARKLGLKTEVSVGRIIRPEYRLSYDNGRSGAGRITCYDNTHSKLPSCVIFGDSFANGIIEFMAQSFSRVMLVTQPNVDFEILAKERPDIVISEQAERFLIRVPVN